MGRYAIGDVQGCFYTFKALLKQIKFNPAQDTLWLVGDLVNRGKHSLEMLDWCYQHQTNLRVVLGNHDLHTLAVAHGVKVPHRSDTLSALIAHPQCSIWLNWLRQQPLFYQEADFAMLHAGLLPQWSLSLASQLAQEVTLALQHEQYVDFLREMYGNESNAWHEGLEGMARLRVITNAFTRLRICNANGEMEFTFKGELKEIPNAYFPWFKAPNRPPYEVPLLFGHWSALGLYMSDGVIGLDTGCLWGRSLTAYGLESGVITQAPLDTRDMT